ncbi:MAG: sulfur carrier protein ThiS [Rikenellaceae bacterium]|nr:sulfur carrier protein ThiS [Rikenellaceae bacterium]
MEIILNNERTETTAVNLAQLISEKLPDTKGIAMAVGSDVISRSAWAETILKEGDNVTIIRATRGG